MRILDRYIVREVFRHALLGLAVFTFVFFVPQLVRLMELFVRHTGSGAQILELFLCIFPGVFTFTLPMAVLIGVPVGCIAAVRHGSLVDRAAFLKSFDQIYSPAVVSAVLASDPRDLFCNYQGVMLGGLRRGST